MLAATLLTVLGLVPFSTATYVLQDDYTVHSFFSMFDFFTDSDPTHGYVNYVDQSTASSTNLTSTRNGVVRMGVDSTNIASGRGRPSVRISSKKSYNEGLVILDLAHMPGNACGTWPAFWMLGPDWPSGGEIDIIEGVNSQVGNAMTLHTSAGCSISNTGLFSGQIQTSNCDVNAAGQSNNAGCGIKTSVPGSYGDGFNALNGGVYATEWTDSIISVWYFPRSGIPWDIKAGSPNPSSWGIATASFSGSCDIPKFFKNQHIVFDTTFCGDWAGNVWSTDSTCSAKASTCQDYVQNNPSAFAESYWSINSLKVYTSIGAWVPGLASPSEPIPSASHSIPVAQSWSVQTAASTPGQPEAWTKDGGPRTTTVGEVAAPSPTTTTVSLGQVAGGDPTDKYVTVSALSYDDFPKEKRDTNEVGEEVEEGIKRRNIHRHLSEHKRHAGHRGGRKA